MISSSYTIVSMTAYENLLCIVSHNGLPMLEAQNLKMKIIDVSKNYHTILETEVPLTPGSNLFWINFSEEGSIFTYDTDGILRNLSVACGNNWIPVLDVKQRYDIEADKFWIVGISEGDIACCILKNRSYPTSGDKSRIQSYKLCIPLLGLDTTGRLDSRKSNPADIEENFMRETLELTHQQWRRHQWSVLRNTRTQKDPSYNQSKSIYTDMDVINKKKALDKITINSIRIAALSEDKAKIFSLSAKIHLVKSYTICISLLNEMKMPLIADELRKIQDKKEIEEQNDRENTINSSQIPDKKRASYTSVSERILKSRAVIKGKEVKKIEVKPASNGILERSLKNQRLEPVKKEFVANPFANKENKKTHNKNLLKELFNNSIQKNPCEAEKPKSAKQKL